MPGAETDVTLPDCVNIIVIIVIIVIIIIIIIIIIQLFCFLLCIGSGHTCMLVQVWLLPHMCSPCLSVGLLLLSLFLGFPQTGLQLLQLSLRITQQHLQGAASLHSDRLNTHTSEQALPLCCCCCC